ncbi:MAG TPA: M15 family metallopeptidase [Bacteroidota bacterium]|nr:M15 family metallopeptidase [Bacteroidota bacterium]
MQKSFAAAFFILTAFSVSSAFQIPTPHTSPDDLVDVRSINRSIALDIRYATKNNFTHHKLYPVARCMLRRVVAESLSAVQKELQRRGLGLKVYDGYRPLSIQKKLWRAVPDDRYVANPKKGSRHNRGAAVDLTIVDSRGKELAMPTPFDDFTVRAHTDYRNLPPAVLKNRALLEQVMVRHGFLTMRTEWWHFDFQHWGKFHILDVPLE